MTNESKQYLLKGKIFGTYDTITVDIHISLSDKELEHIKSLIKASPKCDDLGQIIEDEFPELYDQIYDTLRNAAYDHYIQEYKDYFAESEDDEPGDIELTGEEYSCLIPEEWR
ncbi:MAG: hypothetical protein IKT00_11645 [Prevotella sp.]|nr:hypothetical protein [Prevotella sp.]